MKSPILYTQNFNSIIGPISVAANAEYIIEVNFKDVPENPNNITRMAIEELDQYFHKKIKTFSIPFYKSGTDFQRKVLEEVSKIQYGTTITYAALSEKIGNPLAIRAVARANATNKLPIFIPCHRVIGAAGNLTGYIGGLKAKKTLLELENHFTLF